MSKVFSKDTGDSKDSNIPTEKLFARIGELSLENEFLKKKLY